MMKMRKMRKMMKLMKIMMGYLSSSRKRCWKKWMRIVGRSRFWQARRRRYLVTKELPVIQVPGNKYTINRYNVKNFSLPASRLTLSYSHPNTPTFAKLGSNTKIAFLALFWGNVTLPLEGTPPRVKGLWPPVHSHQELSICFDWGQNMKLSRFHTKWG